MKRIECEYCKKKAREKIIISTTDMEINIFLCISHWNRAIKLLEAIYGFDYIKEMKKASKESV